VNDTFLLRAGTFSEIGLTLLMSLGLQYVSDYPCPETQNGRVLIRIRAAGLNRSELFTRQGHSPSVKFPRVLGIEAVGEVVDNGGDSTWKKGDKVAAVMGDMGREFDGTINSAFALRLTLFA
jgi:NADPH:quinone reductase-like Zn-dependent oxidoreductase